MCVKATFDVCNNPFPNKKPSTPFFALQAYEQTTTVPTTLTSDWRAPGYHLTHTRPS